MQLHMVTQTLRMCSIARQAACASSLTYPIGQLLVYWKGKSISEVCLLLIRRYRPDALSVLTWFVH